MKDEFDVGLSVFTPGVIEAVEISAYSPTVLHPHHAPAPPCHWRPRVTTRDLSRVSRRFRYMALPAFQRPPSHRRPSASRRSLQQMNSRMNRRWGSLPWSLPKSLSGKF